MSDTAALEADIRDIKTVLGRLEIVLARMDERLAHTATKEELARVEGSLRTGMSEMRGDLRAEIAEVRRELETKPSRASMWTMAIALVGLVVTAMGVGAAYLPLVSKALHS